MDVDGVLLTTKNKRAADGSVAFIKYILSHFDCYWLTTHCRDGNADTLLRMLSQYFPSDTLDKLKKIKPTIWTTLKTEGIDFTSGFIWLDDYVFQAEKDELTKHYCLENLILVDLNRDGELVKISNKLHLMQRIT